MAQETKDWDLHPEKYLLEEDGVTFKLNKAGLARKKGGRTKGKTSNYHYSSSTKVKMNARRSVSKKKKRINQEKENFKCCNLYECQRRYKSIQRNHKRYSLYSS